MFRELRGLAKESLIYGLSSVLGKTLNFVLAPLFTYLLTRGESGVVQNAYAYIAFMTVVYGLGLDVAYLRLGRRHFTSAFLCVAGAAVALSAALHFGAEPAGRLVGLPTSAVRYAAWILALDAAATIPYAELRGAHLAGTYAGIRLFGIAMNVALAWVFVGRLGMGVSGVFLANLAASASAFALTSPVLFSRLERPNWAGLRAMLAFGLPLVGALLGSMVVQVADRPILAKLKGLDAAGLYGNAYKLGIFMSLLVGMFDQAWKPFVLERSDRPDVGVLIARVLTYFAVLGCWAFLAIALLVPTLATLPLFAGRPLFHPLYWDGLPIVPVVSLGYLLNGFYFIMLAPLMIAKRTTAVGAATWAGAAVNVAANLLLIPYYELMGAAWATALAYASMAAAVWALSRGARVPYEWNRLGRLAAWTALLVFAGSHLELGGRAMLTLAYPAGLWAARFLDESELAELRAMFKARA